MSRAARREIGDLLAAQLDAIEAEMHARALPYKQAAEYRRRVEIAEAWAADQSCECRTPDDDCRFCYILRVLRGDE